MTLAAPHAMRPRTGRLDIPVVFEMALSCLVIFTFMQGWAAPLTGWASDPTKLAVLKLGFLPAYGATILLIAFDPARALHAVTRTPVIYATVLLAAVSCLWSIDGDATLRRVLALAFTTLAGSVIAARWNLRQLTEMVAGQFALLMVLSVLFAIVPPRLGIMTELFPGAWRGVWTEKNGLGIMMALGAMFCLAAAVLAPTRRWLWLVLLGACAGLVLLSTSKTALLCLLLGIIGVAVVALFRRGPATAVLGTWLGVSVTAGLAGLMVFAPDLLFGLLNKDSTLTGRTEIWTAGIQAMKEHDPILGFGYGVLWDHRDAYDPALWIAHDARFTAGHAHNGWLEVWFGLGVAGLVLWIVTFLCTLARTLVATYSSTTGYLALPYVLIFALMSITEVSVFDYHDGEWTLFVMIACRLALREAPSTASNAAKK